MKNKLTTILLALVAAMTANGQGITDGSRWVNGYELFTAEVRHGGYVYMAGEGRDSGEMTLEPIKGEENTYRLTLSRQAEDWESIDQTAVLKYVNREGVEVIEYWQHHPDGSKFLVDVLERTHKSLEQVMTDDWIALFEGSYKDEDGQPWIFDKNTIKEEDEFMTFTVEKEFYTPTHVIGINDIYQELVPTLEGWNLYCCSRNEEQMFERSGNPTMLHWADPTRGRFHIGSERIINSRIMHCFNKEALRLMRNEIMARHHYPFKSAALKDYFGSQPWYTPQEDVTSPKLSYIEELNVKLISHAESIDDREYYHLME